MLHYITLTDYYIVKTHSDHKQSRQCKCGNKKIQQSKKMTKLNPIHIQIILYYISSIEYYIVKDTFRSRVITAM